MTNVFTRKNRHPRTTTLLDFRDFDCSNTKPTARVLSPTRLANPHPKGLEHQNIPCTSSYLIWHPDFNRKSENYNTMSRHLKFVNFTCDHPEKYNYVKKRAQLPKIKYTENTIMRSSYIHPSRYVELAKLSDTGSRFACSPNNKAVTGIVPNLIVSEYLPVLEK